ncbi:MAG TPA: S8 family serine peptidase, partial [Blastocatellia bacterium]|nr:S8 family serine peptidase [Blastocatellia bacterium]
MKKTSRLLAVIAALFLPSVLWNYSLTASSQDQQQLDKTVDAAQVIGYRSAGDRHKIQISDRRLAREIEKQGGKLVADYGSYQVMQVDSKTATNLSNASEVEVRDDYNLIMLNGGALDTSDDAFEKFREARLASFSGKRSQLIQFGGPIKPEWYDELAKTGVKIVTYVPNNAYLVLGDRASLRRVREMADRSGAAVQWYGDYRDEFKIHPGANTATEKQADIQTVKAEEDTFAIQLVYDKDENDATIELIDELKLEPVIREWKILNYLNFIVRIAPADISEHLAKRPDIISISPYTTPKLRDERQNTIIAGNLTGSAPTPGDYLAYLAGKGFTQAQFTTSGFAVDVGDDGLDNATILPNHPGLYVSGVVPGTSRVVYARKEGAGSGPEIRGCDGHGTLNTHIVGGFVPFAFGSGFPHADAAGFRYGMGVCPFVRVGSSVVFSPGFTSPNFSDWQSRAYNDGSRISTNSWGASVGGAYTVDSQTFDALVRDAQPATAAIPVAGNQQMVILFAAGNDGPGAQTVGAPGTAKNVITVGAAENVHSHATAAGGNNAAGTDGCGLGDTGADNANDMASFSSRGPTTDGRKKPEIVAPGTHVTGGVFQAAGVLPVNGMADACFDAGSVCALPGSGTAGDPDNFFPLGQQWYTTSTGTSHSTPAVAGVTALIRQHFINQSLTAPSPAMTKATLMNTARYLNGTGANDTLWSNSQGMGEAHLNSFFELFTTPSILKDQVGADTFTASGQQRIVTGVVNDMTKPFRVTLAWTDAPGPTSGNSFVNNLDLEVTVGGNT